MPDSLCQKCAGLCCRYIALPIDTPETPDEFEDVRWYLAHEGISVFVEKGEWYIHMATRCKFLNKNNLCDIYQNRPKICRGYRDHNCDFHSGDYGYELHFTSMEELEEYLAEKRTAKAKKSVAKV